MRQMSRNRILALAVCLGLITAVLVYVWLNRNRVEAGAPVAVVVAREDIQVRDIIDQGMVTIRSFPQNVLPAGYITEENKDMLIGQVALMAIKAGAPILSQQVAAKGVTLGLSYAVPPMMRAVTVAVDPIIGVAGFLKPRDHVDVIATFNSNAGTITKTVLQDVELLATGSQVIEGQIDPGTGKPAPPQTQPNATLAVTPADAERLILAESKGTLRLALRPYGDVSRVVSRGISARSLMGVVPPDVPPKATTPATVTRTVYAPSTRPPLFGSEAPPSTWGIQPLPTAASPVVGKKVQVVRGTKVEDVTVPEN